MKAFRHKVSDELGDKLNKQLEKDLDADRAHMSEEELFSFAPFDPGQAERGGYSNYSYWQATFRAFFKNKAAVFFLCLMVCTLLFTFIQPYLPGQRDPLTVHYSEWGLPLNNIPPKNDLGFLLGTNSIGQDLWARIWAGTRTSLFIGFSVALVEAVVEIGRAHV